MASFELLCRMPVILGMTELLAARSRFPGIEDDELIEALKSHHATSGLDYVAALELTAAVEADPLLTLEFRGLLRGVISRLIDVFKPAWLAAVPQGVQYVVQALPRDVAQCFRSAGLLDDVPPPEVVEWWDDLASQVRSEEDFARTQYGRRGERLSFNRELARLKGLGIEEPPKWVALFNNRLGYDILSYEPGPSGVSNRLIEVKTTTADASRFFLSRAEWERAKTSSAAYVLHVWSLPDETLTELAYLDLRDHVPHDQGNGLWDVALIRLDRPVDLRRGTA